MKNRDQMAYRRRECLLAALALAAPASRAQPRKFAVLSLFGNELQVVTRRSVTGSNLTRPDTVTLPVTGGAFDQAALSAADRLLKPLQPLASAEPTLLTSASPSLHQNQDRYFVDGHARLPEPLLKAIREEGASHLILLTRHRGEARLRVREAWVGEGLIEGLGFYVDRSEVLKNLDTREVRAGYVAAFAYLRASLIEVASMRILTERRMQGSRVVVRSTGDGSTDVWEVMDGAAKVAVLNQVVADELARTLPELVAAR